MNETRDDDIPPDLPGQLGGWMLASNATLAVFAPDDTLRFASDSFRRLYGVQPGRQTFASMMRHCHATQIGPRIETDDIDAWLTLTQTKRRSRENRAFEIDFLDGRWMWGAETTFDGGWLLLIVLDFTTVKRREQALRHAHDSAVLAAETDSLTGLPNRRAMMQHFARLREQALATGAPFLIALLDLDHFKAVNDNFGHSTGDSVLQHFAASARQIMRDTDLLGRIGGEEFLLILSGASLLQAHALLERLREQLRHHPFSAAGTLVDYTFSAGIAAWQADLTVVALYRAADRALYQAKAEGRNRTRLAMPQEEGDAPGPY